MAKRPGARKIPLGRRCPNRPPRCGDAISMKYPWATARNMAQDEAGRCLQCRKPSCVAGCPVERRYSRVSSHLITEGDLTGAIRHLWQQKRPAGRVRAGLPPGNPV